MSLELQVDVHSIVQESERQAQGWLVNVGLSILRTTTVRIVG